MKFTQTKFHRFLLVGGIGFVIDASVFFGLVFGVGGSIIWARITASLIAMTATWVLNRSITFVKGRTENRTKEYGKYLLASLLGMAANLVVLNAIAGFDADLYHVPAYLMGTAAGVVVNYTLYDRLVFSGPRSLEP